MPTLFWISLLIGYLAGVSGVVLVYPPDAIKPLTPYLLVSAATATVLAIWLLYRKVGFHLDSNLASETLHAEENSTLSPDTGTNTSSTRRDNNIIIDAAKLERRASGGSIASEPRVTENRSLEAVNFPLHETKPPAKRSRIPKKLQPEKTASNSASSEATVQEDDLRIDEGARAGELAAMIAILEALPGTQNRGEPDNLTVNSTPELANESIDETGHDQAEKTLRSAATRTSASAPKPRRKATEPAVPNEPKTGPDELIDTKIIKLRPSSGAAKSGPDLQLDDLLKPAVAIQPVRLLPQQKLMMIDLDLKGGIKARKFWRGEDEAGLVRQDAAVLDNAVQSIKDLMPGHPAQALHVNLSRSTMEDADMRDSILELAALTAGSHLHVAIVTHAVDPIEIEEIRSLLPEPLGLGLSVDNLKAWAADEAREAGVEIIKISATDSLPDDPSDDLDRTLCLRIDAFNAREIDLVVTGIDRKQTLLNLLDYPIRLGQGLELGSQMLPITSN